jgi:hypothetical protein
MQCLSPGGDNIDLHYAQQSRLEYSLHHAVQLNCMQTMELEPKTACLLALSPGTIILLETCMLLPGTDDVKIL